MADINAAIDRLTKAVLTVGSLNDATKAAAQIKADELMEAKHIVLQQAEVIKEQLVEIQGLRKMTAHLFDEHHCNCLIEGANYTHS